jgi:hypothetical protein
MGKVGDTRHSEETPPQGGKATSSVRQAGRPGRKTHSSKEFQQRIELVAIQLSKRLPKHTVKQNIKEHFGVSARMAEEYISRARELLVDWSGKSLTEHFNEAAAFWLGVIQDPTKDFAYKMRAEENLERLYGLWRRPQRQPVGSPGTRSEPVKMVSFGLVDSPSTDEEECDFPGNGSNGPRCPEEDVEPGVAHLLSHAKETATATRSGQSAI